MPFTQIERFDHLRSLLAAKLSTLALRTGIASVRLMIGEQVGDSNSALFAAVWAKRAAVARLGLHFLPESFVR